MSDERNAVKTLNRTALTELLVRRLKHDEAVVGGIGNSNFDLFAAGHRPQNFYMLGSMGLACPIALGVALAQPERGVIALEGDGSILMGLGCLATIAHLKPRNLTIIIWDNGLNQITGKQRAATAGASDIVAIARAPASPTAFGSATSRISKNCSIGVLTTAGRFCWRSRSTTSRARVRRRALPHSFAAAS